MFLKKNASSPALLFCKAGDHQSERRLRQMHEALDNIRKEASKHIQLYHTAANKAITAYKRASKKQQKRAEEENRELRVSMPEPEIQLPWACELTLAEVLTRLPVVVLGDMNCDPSLCSAAHALLLLGEATVRGKVPDDAAAAASLKVKKQMLGSFVDAYSLCYSPTSGDHSHSEREQQEGAPPTMIVEELYGVITTSADPCYEDDESFTLSPIAVESLQNIFNKFATKENDPERGDSSEKVMCVSDVRQWLRTINMSCDRGSELRGALARMKFESRESIGCCDGGEDALKHLPEDEVEGYLDWEGFLGVYEETVNEGTEMAGTIYL